MKDKLIWSIFWVMVAVFVLMVATMFVVPALELPMPFIIFPAFAVLVALGVTLIVLTVKRKVGGILKKFLLLTGSSAVGIPVFAVLHNLVYALLVVWFGEDFWGANGDEPVFFILAVIVCPIGFLVGIVGSIVLAIKNKPTVPAGTS